MSTGTEADAPKRRLRVLVVDDKVMPRIALKAMLAHNRAFEIAGEASSGAEGVRLVHSLKPDIVLLDVDMPEMDGAATAKAILDSPEPHPIVLAWTVSEHSDDVIRMVKAGCSGFILKDAGPDELMRAMNAGLRGETPVPRKLIPEIISRAVVTPVPAPGTIPAVSPRELEVLQRLARGQSNKDMAREMKISRRSVDSHLSNVYRKLGVTSRGQAVHQALRLGLISAETI